MKKFTGIILIVLSATVLALFSACNVVPAKTYAPTADEYFSYALTDGGYSVAAAEGKEFPTVLRFPEEYNGQPVVAVADKGFRGIDKVEKIYIPKCYASLGSEAFAYMPDLKRVYIGTVGAKSASETAIGWGAFLGDGSSVLLSVDIADNVKEIGEYAFAWHGKLSSVMIGEGLETLADNAFTGSDNAVFSVDKDNPRFVSVDNGKPTAKQPDAAGEGDE